MSNLTQNGTQRSIFITDVLLDSISIEKLNLSARSLNALQREKIDSIKSLIQCTEERLRTIRNLGSKSVDEILCAITAVNNNIYNDEWIRNMIDAPEHETVKVFRGLDGIIS